MGRRMTIDRAKVLDAAESVIAAEGARALIFESVAAAAGVTKGGVQSCFGTKEALIEALLRRWGELYDEEIARRTGLTSDAASRVRAHVEATAHADDSSTARSAALIAALLQSPQHLGWVQDWYADRIADIAALPDERATAARLAFLATEGLFFLRHFGLVPMNREQWEQQFVDIEALVSPPAGQAPRRKAKP